MTYLDAGGRLRGLAEPTSEEENRQMVDRLLATTERQLNAKQPLVQARVLDGTRPPHRGDLADRRPLVGHLAPLHRA